MTMKGSVVRRRGVVQGRVSPFGLVTTDELRRAELFYADLMGARGPRPLAARVAARPGGRSGEFDEFFAGESLDGAEGFAAEGFAGESLDGAEGFAGENLDGAEGFAAESLASEDFAAESLASEDFASEDFASEDLAAEDLEGEEFESESFDGESFESEGSSGESWSEDAEFLEGSGRRPVCSVWLPAVTSSAYTDWVAAPTTGLVTLLINGRNSNGTGPDLNRTEPLDEMQRAVVALGRGDFCYLSAWFFEPTTDLTAGPYLGETTWGGLLGKKAEEGVEVRILINDFDPFSGLDTWERTSSLVPLEALVRALSSGARGRFKYLVTRHPANYAGLRAAAIRALHSGGSGPIFIGSHHQKFMVARRGGSTTAFCGGLDIESRKVPSAWSYSGMIGWHDLTLKMEGPITRDLERQFVERWNREQGGARNALLPGWGSFGTLSLPASLPAADNASSKRIQPVQMTRTISSDATFAAYGNNRDDIRRSYRNIIQCARSHLYLENQYFRDLSLADEIAARGRAISDLRAIFVVLANAAADDGANPLTSHGDHLQHQFFTRITAAFGSRAAIYTMFNRSVHSKLLIADDRAMSIGSANANVRSFDLDSELNVTVENQSWVRAARVRLWSHNLGIAEATVGGWTAANFITRWNAVATANAALRAAADRARMAGEGVIVFDWRANPGSSSALVPDYLVRLDVAPAPNLIYGPQRQPGDRDTDIA